MMQKTELARLLGVSRETVHRLAKRGMPTNSLEAATEWRKRNLEPVQTKQMRIDGNMGGKSIPNKAQSDSRTLEELQAAVSNSQLNLDGNDADELYKNSRALKEKALALQAAAEHEKFVGTLVEKEHVEKIVFERSRSFRDGLLALSRRLSPELAGENDISVIESRLNSEFRQILVHFAHLPVIE